MITIYLAHEEVRTEGPTRQQHKLGQGVPASDVRAPPEIQKVQLDAIRLRMDISCESPLKRRKLAPNLEAKTSFEPDAEHCFGRATEARRSYTAPSQQEHRAISRTQTDPNLPAHCSRYDMLLGSEPAESRIARSNITQSMAQKRSCSTEDLNAAGQQEISRQEFLGILDAGLRMAISPSPKCLARGVRMDGNESCKCLANTLPTLWSPGYLYAMSSRSVLLPTISHGLNGICAEHAKSSRLRSKMIELERRHDARHDYLRHNSDSGRASSTVSSVLWRTMQTSLFDMEAANLLIPLSRKNGDDNLNDLDLLDSRYDETWHNGPHSCTCSDDDESLLDRAEIAEGATALVPGEGLKRRTPACLMPEMSPQMPSGGPLDLGMFEDDEELLSNGESLEHLAGMDDGDMIATETPRLTESQDEGIATVTRHSFNSDDEILPI
ncbi:Hypothetical predicted protein [Lecanosticta acicola]|uniref:Uncharacterized protein n=1 Tax=Lecanosticta acicola TaxID=111012 RepID=A0AAI8Z823_9PEZI|nr:Hypothetical predicted protein [Lecanosticta acicola]